MCSFLIKGEKRAFNARTIVIDENMDRQEADDMVAILKKDHPSWKFWVEEQENEDELPSSVCAKS